MKRKKIVKVPVPENMSVADCLVVLQQTIVVTMVMQKDIDPNEAYDVWEENKGQILACLPIIDAILKQYGDEMDVLRLSLPMGVAMGGYKIDDLSFITADGGLPF